MVEICRIFTFSLDFVFSFSSKAEQGFPDAHGARHPLALRLVSQKPFRKICSWTRWGTPIRPVGPKFKASPASGPNEGPSPTTTQARRPIPLAEMIHTRVEEQGLRSNAVKGDQVGYSQRKGVPGYPRRREEKLLSWRIKTISCQRLCGAAPCQDRLTPCLLPPSARPGMIGLLIAYHVFRFGNLLNIVWGDDGNN